MEGGCYIVGEAHGIWLWWECGQISVDVCPGYLLWMSVLAVYCGCQSWLSTVDVTTGKSFKVA